MKAGSLIGKRVRLIKFQGRVRPLNPIRESENYWIMIGKEGIVIATDLMKDMTVYPNGRRVLVEFDEDVQKFGLHCHNEVDNALWILVDDLTIAVSE